MVVSIIDCETPAGAAGEPAPTGSPAPGSPAPVGIVLFEPDIPQNAGAMIRLCTCFGVRLEIIEPCGFVFDDRRLRRVGMDYRTGVALVRHTSWQAFRTAPGAGRLVLLTGFGDSSLPHFRFRPGDRLMLGRESAGVPDSVRAAADVRLRIPLRPPARSLNVAVAAAIALGEALRQLGGYAEEPPA